MSAAHASGGSARSRPHHEAEALLDQLAQDLGREEAAARARADALTASSSTKVLEERGVLLRKARVIDVENAMLGRVRLLLGDDKNRAGHVDDFDARAGAAVHLIERDAEGKATVVGHGVVTRRRRGEIQLVFDASDAVADLDTGDAVDVLLAFDEVSIRRLKEGVARARQSTGRMARLVEHLLGVVPPRPTRLPDEHGIPPLGLSSELNVDQRTAALHALFNEDVALVHGPPGTGKTRVLVDVVLAAVRRGERVLCLTASNAAVDHLALSLLAVEPTLPLARFGNPARAHEDLEAHTLASLTAEHPHRVVARGLVDRAHALLRGARRRSDTGREAFQRQREARAEAGGLFAEARQLERTAAVDVLRRTRVLCGTLTGRLDDLIGHDDGDAFDVLVIDEASQALTPAVLSPLPLLSKTGRVVLAGDHKQLPPVVIADDATVLKQTAFAGLRQKDVDVGAHSHLLTVQHRMHEALMAFPSARFYDGRLVAHHSVAHAFLDDVAATLDDGSPRISLPWRVLDVVDCAGAGFDEARAHDSASIENLAEARVVGMLVQDLIDAGANAGDIGVITPYAAQATRLVRQLGALVDRGLEVDSVDGFQGREKRVIVFSAVRSNSDASVGFLADQRRLNVAITRARHKLLVVGDSATLSSDATWRALFDHAIATDSYRSVFEVEGAV